MRKVFAVSAILFVPALIIFFFLAFGKNQYQALPIFGKKIPMNEVNGKADTLYHSVGSFFLTDLGKDAENEIKNKIVVTAFVNPSCLGSCDFAYGQIKRFAEAVVDESAIKLLVFVPDSAKNNFAAFKKKFSLEGPNVLVCPIPADTLASVAVNEYLLNADNFKGQTMEWQLVLIDWQRRIRGYYDSTKKRDIDDLLGSLSVLGKEKDIVVGKAQEEEITNAVKH